MLAAYQCLLAHGALVLLWQSQVPMDSSAQDCASALKNWAFPSPILGLQVPTSLPLRYARTLTTVHTPDFDTLSQRHINALSTRYRLGSQAGCVPLGNSLLPPLLTPAQTQLCIYSPQKPCLRSIPSLIP